MIFARFKTKPKKEKQKTVSTALASLFGFKPADSGRTSPVVEEEDEPLGGMGTLGTHFKTLFAKEMQTITIEEIKKALLEDSKSEKSELFQLLCALSPDADQKIRDKISQIKAEGDDYLSQEVELFYTN